MNSERLHRRIAGIGLILGGVAFAGGDLLRRVVEPTNDTVTSVTAAVHDHSGMWLAAALLAFAGALLLVPGIVAAVRLVRARGMSLAIIGGYLTGIGLLASLVHASGYFGMYGVYARSGLDDATIRSFDTAAGGYAFFGVGIALFLVGMTFGPVLLTIGLRRAHVVPVWVPVAAVVFVVSGSVGGVPAGIAGIVAATATFGVIGVLVLRQRRADGGSEHVAVEVPVLAGR